METLAWVNERKRERSQGVADHSFTDNLTKKNSSQNKPIDDVDIDDYINRSKAILEDTESHLQLFSNFVDNGISGQQHQQQLLSFDELIATTAICDGDDNDTKVLAAQKYLRDIIRMSGNDDFGDDCDSCNKALHFDDDGGDVANPMNHKQRPMFSTSSSCEKLKKTIPVFDPSELNVIKRSILSDAKFAEMVATEEAANILKRKFKARPLPGGVQIKNDLFAATQATKGKNVRKFCNKEGDTLTGRVTGPVRVDISTLINESNNNGESGEEKLCQNNSDSNALMNASQKRAKRQAERSRRKAAMLLRNKAKHETNVRSLDISMDDYNYDSIVSDRGCDGSSLGYYDIEVSELYKEIVRLKIILGRKRELYSYKQECLAMYDDSIDPLTMSYSRDVLDVSLSDNEDNDSVVDYRDRSFAFDLNSSFDCSTNSKSESPSIYDRQKEWLSSRKLRWDSAREEKERLEMELFTGQPLLSTTKESWEKAKKNHEEAARIAGEKERVVMQENGLKLGTDLEMLPVETKTNKQPKFKWQQSTKRTLHELKDSIEKLSKPRQVISSRDSPANLGSSTRTSNEPYTDEEASIYDDKNVDNALQKQKEQLERSLVDMSDQEFNKMVRSIGIKVAKQRKSSNGPIRCTSASAYKKPLSIDDKTNKSNHGATKLEFPPSKFSAVKKQEAHSSFSLKAKKMSSCYETKQSINENNVSKKDYLGQYSPTKIERTSNNETYQESEIRNEVSLAQASSALDAAEAALCGLMGGVNNETGPDHDPSSPHERVEIEPSSPEHPISTMEVEPISVNSRTLEPYERYELEKSNFFDRSSSEDKGRFRVRDARQFRSESMRRVMDSSDDGVMLLLGKRQVSGGDDSSKEVTITIMFDRSKFSEHEASVWWRLHRNRFI